MRNKERIKIGNIHPRSYIKLISESRGGNGRSKNRHGPPKVNCPLKKSGRSRGKVDGLLKENGRYISQQMGFLEEFHRGFYLPFGLQSDEMTCLF